MGSEVIYTVGKMRRVRPGRRVEGKAVAKTIHVRIDKDDPAISLNDVLARVQEIQRAHPELDVFFDGDEYAICSRPRRKA